MSLLDRLMSCRPVGQGQNAVGSDAARQSLTRALERETRRGSGGAEPVRYRFLGQVLPAATGRSCWPAGSGATLGGMMRWPRSLAPTTYAFNLWPLQPGRAGARRRHDIRPNRVEGSSRGSISTGRCHSPMASSLPECQTRARSLGGGLA